jgi:hypothetical protein
MGAAERSRGEIIIVGLALHSESREERVGMQEKM